MKRPKESRLLSSQGELEETPRTSKKPTLEKSFSPQEESLAVQKSRLSLGERMLGSLAEEMKPIAREMSEIRRGIKQVVKTLKGTNRILQQIANNGKCK